ncbi:hypothetical protein CYJ23_04050 [Actinomyces oris]|uniref:DUF7847 domain-containing protein n=1 Tax=Actinomyces oris TaxID=544580 RepID=UPI000C770869|nr:hypothetical protein [Actinomyces oris]PKY75191.1 hypothetical protein CYJ23_04050 [Actinomyces oris]
MSTDFPPDGSGPSGEPDREAHGTSGSDFVGGDQDGWQAPDAGAFTEAPSYPAPGSAAGPQYPGYGGYQTPPVGQPGYPGGSVPGSAPYPGAPGYPEAPGGPGYPGYGGYTSALAPKPSIIPLRPLSIGEILGGAFESLRANPKAMFVPSLVVMSIVGLLSAGSFALFLSRLGLPNLTSGKVELSDADVDKIGASLVGLLVQLGVTSVLSMMATSIIIGLLIVTVSRTILGRKASLGDVWQRTRPRVWALIGQTLLIQFILAVITAVFAAVAVGIGWALLGNVIANGAAEDSAGTIILAILAILAVIAVLGLAIFALMCKLCLAPAALVLENIGVMEGISRSWTLTRGYFWRIFGIRLLSFIIVFFASQIVSQGVSIVMQGLLYAAPDMTLAILVASTLLSSLVQAAILPFDSAVVALMYTDLRMRSEGLDVELRHAAGV